jgi:endonuclease/exonuclease/phosphatase (EEP) superfamily protein YafD
MTIFLLILSSVLSLFTLLSLVRHDYWVFRVCEYPRLQKLVLTATCLICLVFYYEPGPLYPVLIGVMSINAVYLLYLILPFTVLGKKQVMWTARDLPQQRLSLMVANVYQYNRNASGCLTEIQKADPDIVILLETDQWWQEQTAELEKEYPYKVLEPLENTYGMLLFSRLELIDPAVKYLVEEGVPSIHTKLRMKNGQLVQLYALHPSPPVPNENPRSTERDKELLLVADLAKETKLPVIVIGDLNDVAWSYTTELFLKMSGLLDPRRGRGFYNSFHAHYPFLRFPLDHAFISTDFKIRSMRRLKNFNSDHFPIFLHLQYEAKASEEQDSLEPEQADVRLAEEKKNKI